MTDPLFHCGHMIAWIFPMVFSLEFRTTGYDLSDIRLHGLRGPGQLDARRTETPDFRCGVRAGSNSGTSTPPPSTGGVETNACSFIYSNYAEERSTCGHRNGSSYWSPNAISEKPGI